MVPLVTVYVERTTPGLGRLGSPRVSTLRFPDVPCEVGWRHQTLDVIPSLSNTLNLPLKIVSLVSRYVRKKIFLSEVSFKSSSVPAPLLTNRELTSTRDQVPESH